MSPEASGLTKVLLEPVSSIRRTGFPLIRTLTNTSRNFSLRAISSTFERWDAVGGETDALSRGKWPVLACPRHVDAVRAVPEASSPLANHDTAMAFITCIMDLVGDNAMSLPITCQGNYDGKKMPTAPFARTSGRLCLDFTNTMDDRLDRRPQDRLAGFAELVAFGEQTGILSVPQARRLRQQGRDNPLQASRVLGQAVAVREMLFRIFYAVTSDHRVSNNELDAFNEAVRRFNGRSVIAPGRGKTAWKWVDNAGDAERLTGTILRSAVEVLTSTDIQHLKRCAADRCCWFFVDESHGHNRRWCDMKTCGSRQKARAYYHRKTARCRS